MVAAKKPAPKRPMSGAEYDRYKSGIANAAKATGRVYGALADKQYLKEKNPAKTVMVATGGKTEARTRYALGAAKAAPKAAPRKGGR